MSLIDTGVLLNGSQGQRWKLVEQLGRGKCCDVYKSVLIDEDFQVAVKVYKKGLQYEGAQQRERLLLQIVQREQGTCKQLVQVVDSFQVAGQSMLVEELLDFSLSQIALMTKGQGFSLYLIQKLARDVLISLKCVHSSGFVHSDIKPCNLMWSAQSSCLKLIDFGLSFHISDKDVGQIQSPSYRAPEAVWSNQGRSSHLKLTQAVDMWSLGCLLLWMFTGHKMFQKEPSGPCRRCLDGGVESCEYDIMAQQMIDGKIARDTELGIGELTAACQTFKMLISGLLQCKSSNRPSCELAQANSFFSLSFEPKFCDLLLLPTCVLRMLNIIDQNLLKENDLHDIQDDIMAECRRYGNVLSCVIPKEGRGKGMVYLKFEKAQNAITAFEQVNGKIFDGRTIITTYYPLDDFDLGNFF